MNNFFSKYFFPRLLILAILVINYAQIFITRTRGNIAFISGGVGEDEANAMQTMSKNWPLSIEFKRNLTCEEPSVAQVNLRILGANSEPIFESIINGPMFLGRLMPGNYGLSATKGEVTQTRDIQIYEGKSLHIVISWGLSNATV